MAFFVAFLAFVVILNPLIASAQAGRIALSLVFFFTLVFGALATVQHRFLAYLIVALAISTLGADLVDEFSPGRHAATLETTLRLAGLSILVCLTLKRIFSPGPVTRYRVIGGIAGYLLIGLTWAFAYQLVSQQEPNAIHFLAPAPDVPSRLPTRLMYFSFVTLTTVGYGDAYPERPATRSLAVAEALVGQLYVAILIASLVGMALQTKTEGDREGRLVSDEAASTKQSPLVG